jgi:tyrosyl-tRNA synthetase
MFTNYGKIRKRRTKAAQIFYPCMQAADIFNLNADIAQLGMDQRKVNVLAERLHQNLD